MAEKKLTVLQMLPALEGGGVERGTLEVAEALAGRGHRSLVISAGGRMVQQLEAEGSEHFCWPVDRKTPWTLRLIWPLRRFLKEQGVDILHFRSRVPGWVAYLAWRGMDRHSRPRLISTVHGLHSVSAYSAVMTKGERVIAVSKTVQRYILENYPSTPPERINLVYRGVDPAAFPYGYKPADEWLTNWYKEFPQLRGKKVLTLAGRITRLKGHHDFIGLIQMLIEDGMPVHGLIVGGEDPRRLAYAEELQEKISSLGLQGDITFTGNRSDIRDVYAVSDLVLSLSTKPESFGRSVLEALSMGVPVVGYDHGGVGEILKALFVEGLTPLSDIDQLKNRVKKLLNSRCCVEKNKVFLHASMIEKTLAIYAECSR
ncbi:glycosyltransferase family 4 protein [Sedimenticola selenatireducens]|uniref:glycosyltransferase family 4 protein n=1 Tax=Sedimenticola selenatireducens TaxID=191960 RepID=UPI0004906811|nr:glycosyltransferase family 4 protein [Sedimenticola selenatireducens]